MGVLLGPTVGGRVSPLHPHSDSFEYVLWGSILAYMVVQFLEAPHV